MCINLGKLGFLVDPTALARKAAVKVLGVDATTATILSGDLLGHKEAAKQEEQNMTQQTAANNEAWQKYYASRKHAAATGSVLSGSGPAEQLAVQAGKRNTQRGGI